MENQNDTETIVGTALACCLLVLSYGAVGWGAFEIVRAEGLVRAIVMTPLR